MADYLYDNFSGAAYDLDRFKGPSPGDKAPNGDVITLAGETRKLLDFKGKFLVLEVGSITCPLFQSRRNGMAQLHASHPECDFAVLYVREAHPGQKIAQPKDIAAKTALAKRLQNEDAETREILIDDLNGAVHAALGGYPNSIFIINQSCCVVWRSDWNNAGATKRALSRLLAGKPAGGEGLFLPAKPPVAVATLRRAGRAAVLDFLRDFPHLVWKNLLKRNFRLLTGRRAKIEPGHIC